MNAYEQSSLQAVCWNRYKEMSKKELLESFLSSEHVWFKVEGTVEAKASGRNVQA